MINVSFQTKMFYATTGIGLPTHHLSSSDTTRPGANQPLGGQDSKPINRFVLAMLLDIPIILFGLLHLAAMIFGVMLIKVYQTSNPFFPAIYTRMCQLI